MPNTPGAKGATTKGAKRTTNKGAKYAASALPTTAVQYRHASGTTGTPQATAYTQAMRALAAWAHKTPNAPTVHALVHLAWCAGSGARVTNGVSNSAACKHAVAAKLPAAQWAVGQPAGGQVAANMAALATAGAPKQALATVWATYTGKATAPRA